MTTRTLARKLHLWLGITTGIVVSVIALSGCLYVFERELRDRLDPFRCVEPEAGTLLPPSALRAIAERQLPGETASRVYYEGRQRAAYVQFGNIKTPYYKLAFLNPYDGRVLAMKDMNQDFLHVVFSLHYRLLLEPELGTTIVDCATLVFVFILISGLVNWWPRRWAVLAQRLRIRWQTTWRRRNYDLHNVLGFYVFPLALIFALTGLVWGFDWFNGAVRWLASGGWRGALASRPATLEMPSPTDSPSQNVDAAWQCITRANPDAEATIVFFPSNSQRTLRLVVNPQRYTYYRTDHYDFDPHTLAAAPGRDSWGRYQDATAAGVVRRVNFDVHSGAILGLPGKILACLASLIVASLPVTGFLVWRGKGRSEAATEAPRQFRPGTHA